LGGEGIVEGSLSLCEGEGRGEGGQLASSRFDLGLSPV